MLVAASAPPHNRGNNMQLFGYDIYITTRGDSVAGADTRPYFSVQRGWTVDDTELHIGNYEVIISKLDSTAPVTADVASS